VLRRPDLGSPGVRALTLIPSSVAGVLVAWVVAAAVLPNGLPPGIVLYGLTLGMLSALTAIGLVLVYRSSRIINFAQAEIGGLAATVGVVMVLGWHLSYWVALPAGFAVAVAIGAGIDAVVIGRLFSAPRLIVTVATVGVLQILGAGEIVIPQRFAHLAPLAKFKTPFTLSFRVRPITFTGDYVVALVVAPVAMAAIGLFLWRSDTGIAIRAAADSGERALLLGIPVRRLSRIVWMVAGGLSGLAALLSAPILTPQLGGVGGPVALLAPLTAAVVGRMESLPRTALAAMFIGVFQQAVFWNYPQSSAVDVALFATILVALLAQRRRYARVEDRDLGGYIAVREVRPVPAALREVREVVAGRVGVGVAVCVAAIVLPLVVPTPRVILLTYMALYGIVGVSLVVLTGWAGQISLGQFAFVGIGAGVTAGLLVHQGADLFLAALVGALVAAGAAVLVGLPALRIQGLMLAAATLAFAVPVSSFLLNRTYFPSLAPDRLVRPILLDRFDLERPLPLYYLCLGALAVAVVLAWNFRRSRAGRAVLAVRDNERAAAAHGISAVRVKLTAFALSGALAGLAGALYVVAQRKVGFLGFDPILSLEVFTAVVVGGLGSLSGALLGAAYVQWAQSFLHGGAKLLATGAGLLLLLLIVPGGLGEIAYAARDRLLRLFATRRGIDVPTFAFAFAELALPGADLENKAAVAVHDSGLAALSGVDAGYDHLQVLFGLDVAIARGELMTLLGTNGAGKSTALRVFAGLLRPTAGRVVFDGRDITDLSPIERVRAGIVTVPGGRGVFPSLTVAENLRMAGWLARRDPASVAATDAKVTELFPPLALRRTTKASLLSGGEQQMLTLAQSLYLRPRLLLIDELSLGLAPVVVSSLLDVVRQINAEGTAVMIVEQSANIAASIAGHAVFMEKGQVRFDGRTVELTERTDLLRAVFLTPDGRGAGARAVGGRVKARARVQAPRSDGAARLELSEIDKRFGGVTAVSGVSLTVADDQIVGIIGANGAGKTTLFDVCSGFLAPDAGTVQLDGVDVTAQSAAARAERGLGRSFQDARLFPSMTVTEALATALERHIEVRDPLACMFRVGTVVDSERAASRRVEELVELLNLGRWRDAFVFELSTGTRRVLELGCAIAHVPRVLLLDEPSTGIAQRETEALADLLLRLRAETGASLAVIEHDVPLVSSIADELVCLHLGEVIARGRPSSVLADPAVVAAYVGTDEASIRRSGPARRGSRRAARRA